MLNRIFCITLWTVAFYAMMAVPAQAAVIGVVNGDFETYDGEQQIVNDGWYENGDTWYGTFCMKSPGWTDTTEFVVIGYNGYIYQSIGSLDANMTATISGLALNGPNWNEDFGTMAVKLFVGNVTPAHGSSLASLGATEIASTTLSSADIGLDDNDNPAEAAWSWLADLSTANGYAGQPLWLELSGVGSGRSLHLDNIAASSSIIPEPSTLYILASALAGLVVYAFRKRK